MRTTRIVRRLKSAFSQTRHAGAYAGCGPAPSSLKASLLALEPRILLDAAAVATGAEVAADQVAQEQAEAAVNAEAQPGSAAQEADGQDPLLQALASYEPPSARREIIFLDRSVKDYETLLAGIHHSAEVVLLDDGRDGVTQMAEALAGRTGFDAIHLVTHGDQAELQLGAARLTLDSMAGEYAEELTVIGQALSHDADILVYGCNFGEGDAGREAASRLAGLTGAEVAASDDLTGAKELGGDWDLEHATGRIETAVAFSADTQGEWKGLLSVLTVNTTNDVLDGDATSIATLLSTPGLDGVISLREAIIAANNTPNIATPDEIHFDIAGSGPHTIVLASALPTITDPVIIDATTEPDYAGSPVVVLDDGAAVVTALDLTNTSDGSAIRGFAISGFTEGILIEAGADANTIADNYIGTDVTGSVAAGNENGIVVEGANNIIERNVISGNTADGIRTRSATGTGNTIRDNLIGTNAAGTAALGNGEEGLDVRTASNTITDNVIGGNNRGIRLLDISGGQADNNIIQGNFIGTDVTGTLNLGHATEGILLSTGAAKNTIGGTGAGEGNTIAFNTGVGVSAASASGTGNTILRNSIFSNSGLGIDLNSDGVTPNDVGDGDTGPNNLQNYPVLGSVAATASGITITGTLNSTATTTFTMDFFSSSAANPSGFGEGETYLGSTSVTTDGGGNATFNVTLPVVVPAGAFVTATMTDPSNNTSEFSAHIAVTGVNDAPVNSVPGAQVTNQDTPLVFSSANGNVISISDVDAGSNSVQATVEAANGTLTLNGVGGLTFTVGDGINDGFMTFTGTLADINAALDGLTFDPTPGFTGSAGVRIAVDDLGHSASGGPQTDADQVDITVDAINHQLSATNLNQTKTYIEDAASVALDDIVVTDPDSGETVTATLTLADPAAGSLTTSGSATYHAAGGVWTITDTVANVNTALADVAFAPASNYDQDTTLAVNIADGGENGTTPVTGAITLDVTPVNDKPTARDDGFVVDEEATLDSNTAWFDGGWSSRRTLSFDNTLQAENLTDFPVLIALDSTKIDYAKTQDNGEDLRFVDGDGTVLAHEVEVWNEAGTSYVWVKVPQIDGSSPSDFIWMYYGNASAPDAQNAAAVWSNAFRGVYHLAGAPAPSGPVADSTGAFHGTNVGTTSATGYIGGAQEFNGIDRYVDLGADQPFLNSVGGATISGWVKADNTGSGAVLGVSRGGLPNANSRATLDFKSQGLTVIARSDDVEPGMPLEAATGLINQNSWHYVTGVIDYAGDTLAIYIDGVQVTSASSVGFNATATPGTNSALSALGANEDGTGVFDGILDEVRLAATARSADWIAAEYASMSGAFVTYGYEQAVAGVLGNDRDVEGNALTAVLVSGPSNAASFILNADGSFVYTPAVDSAGVDSFTYAANDGTTDSDPATVTITVNPINDDPAITSNGGGATAAVSVTENGTAVTTVTATDVDVPADTLTYSLAGGADQGLFTLDSATGVLTFVAAPNFEAPADADADNIYDVTVQVSDGQGGTDTQALTVTVTNDNEAPTAITPTAFALNENLHTTGGLNLGVLSPTDPDAGDTFTYTIQGGADAAAFSIGGAGGNELMLTAGVLNFEGQPAYTVVIRVTDAGGKSHDETITVTVTDRNEAPAITSNGGGATAGVSVAENSAAVTTVTATDVDLSPDTLTYSLAGGADQGLFTLDSATGVLTFVAAPDFEAPADADADNIYDVTVQVSDGEGGTDTQALSVTVTNGNDSPVLTANTGSAGAEGGTAPITASELKVTDVDNTPDQVTYAVVSGPSNGRLELTTNPGVPITSFTQDDITNNRLVYVHDGSETTAGSFSFTVSDGAGGTIGTTTFTVTVAPVNDAPAITSDGGGAAAAVSVAGPSTTVTIVTATDPDQPADTLTYSLAGGPDAARFTIDTGTGALSFTAVPDFDTPTDADGNNLYHVQVQVSDGQGGVDVQTLTVSVTDVKEASAPPLVPPLLGDTRSPAGNDAEPEARREAEAGEPAREAQAESSQNDAGEMSVSEQPAPGGSTAAAGGVPAAALPSPPAEAKAGATRPTGEPPAMRVTDAAGKAVDLAPPGDALGGQGFTDSPLVGAVKPLAQETEAFMTRVHAMAEDIKRAMREDHAWKDSTTAVATASTLAISTAFVVMAMKSSLLLSSLLATLPTWRFFDPLPVLSLSRQEREALKRRAQAAAQTEDEQFRSLGHLLEQAAGTRGPSTHE